MSRKRPAPQDAATVNPKWRAPPLVRKLAIAFLSLGAAVLAMAGAVDLASRYRAAWVVQETTHAQIPKPAGRVLAKLPAMQALKPLRASLDPMLALLNDGAILSIAYDNVQYRNQPESWDMRLVLGISTVLGVTGVVAAFGLFYLGERVFHLDRAHIQTLMYLKLSVAGHLTIFLTRTRGPFWSIRPARILLMAVCLA